MILINSWLREIRHWRMTTTLMKKPSREGLHKLLCSESPQQWWLQWMNWKQLRPRESVITSQIFDAGHRADPKIAENIDLVGVESKPQYLVWTPALSTEFLQSSQWYLSECTLINTSSPIASSSNHLWNSAADWLSSALYYDHATHANVV